MRRPDWVSRMWATIHTYRHAPFQFGKTDCALFSCRIVDAITDSELAGSFSYADKRGAMRYMRAQGGLEAAVTRRLGAPIAGHNAERGEICLIDATTLGVCVGPHVAVVAQNGLDYLHLKDVVKHWRVE